MTVLRFCNFAGEIYCWHSTKQLSKHSRSIIFIIFGMLILFSSKSRNVDEYFESCWRSPFYLGFTLIFLSEWGGKSQFVSGLFSTQYNYLLVLAGVMIALGVLSSMVIYFGGFISHKVERDALKKLSGALFIYRGIIPDVLIRDRID